MVAKFAPIRVLGMMSGTSIDGVDAAVLETDGESVLEFGPSGFEAYGEEARSVLRAALGKWPGTELDEAAEVVLKAHAELASGFEVDAIGFHGQTLAHDPKAGRTHQLGDGARLSQMIGRDVVWDFRTADMKEGGEGAPLAPFFHHALAQHAGLSGPVAFLNLGGVGNVTWVDPSITQPEDEGALLAFDTGPANALLDDFLSARADVAYDKGGALAAKGRVHQPFVERLNDVAYLGRTAPKSLDRDDFSFLQEGLDRLSVEDGAATLTAITAACVGRALADWFEGGTGRGGGA